jgi:hypothetical protein
MKSYVKKGLRLSIGRWMICCLLPVAIGTTAVVLTSETTWVTWAAQGTLAVLMYGIVASIEIQFQKRRQDAEDRRKGDVPDTCE